MSRLIDVDKLLEELREYHPLSLSHGILSDIEYFPTAYDVDKVLDELMERRYTYCGLFEYEEDLYKDGRFDAYKDAIEIVKRGGVK